MFKVAIDAHWQLRRQDGTPLVPRLTALLVGIQQTGTLAAACRIAGLTYRYAWGLLRDGERAFGHPLVASQRGRGAKLTALGERLAWADQRIAARLTPLLESLATEVESEIERALSVIQPVLRVHATHGFAVETLRQFLAGRQIPIDLKYRDSDEALTAFIDRQCDVVGLHLPVGDLETEIAAHYAPRVADDWTLTLASGYLAVADSSAPRLVNASGASLAINSESGGGNGPDALSAATNDGSEGTLLNDGVVEKTSGSGTTYLQWSIDNEDAVDVQSGTVDIAGGETTGAGTWNGAAGTGLVLANGGFDSGPIETQGTLSVQGSARAAEAAVRP